MTQVHIPETVFADLVREWESIFQKPVCACFLAIDAALPTETARLQLDFMRYEGKLLRLELRHFCRDNPDWAKEADQGALRWISRFQDDLPVYIAVPQEADDEQLRQTLRERMKEVCFELALMLQIFEQAVSYDPQRLRWLFQVAIQAMRDGKPLRDGRPNENANPIGRALLALKSPASETKAYAQNVSSADPPPGYHFETFRAIATTQLRALYCFAMELNKGDAAAPERFDLRYPQGRDELIAHLAEVLLDGLEIPPSLRSPKMKELLGDGAWEPNLMLDEKAAQRDLIGWFSWATEHASSEKSGLERFKTEFAIGTLSRLEPRRYRDRFITDLGEACKLTSEQSRKVLEQRKALVAKQRPGSVLHF